MGLELGPNGAPGTPLSEEIDHALHPVVHERRVPSYGCIVDPTVEVDRWTEVAQVGATRRVVGTFPIDQARRFADGVSSWLERSRHGEDASVVFDRPVGSERDLVVLSTATGATLVQRHPLGVVRVVGDFGVLRYDGLDWHHEPPVADWITATVASGAHHRADVLRRLLEFAVHDLGARGIGAILVHRPEGEPFPAVQPRLPVPPPLQIDRPADLAPLIHAISQVDGATVFDSAGTLRQLGARLVPSPEAESEVDGFRGMRHTAARRYSYDDPEATLIVVSEDGPVTVVRAGRRIGRRERDTDEDRKP